MADGCLFIQTTRAVTTRTTVVALIETLRCGGGRLIAQMLVCDPLGGSPVVDVRFDEPSSELGE